MGVYHFSGIGRSIGAITAPLSYLSARKATLNEDGFDPLFQFSGERIDANWTRGSVEALVLFTSKEIFNGDTSSLPYARNVPGKGAKSACEPERSMRELVEKLVPKAMENICRVGDNGHKKPLMVYWAIHDWTDPLQTFERVYRVMTATKAVEEGKVGKEIWVNLTGGSNIVNSALQLSASLSGVPAKSYYVINKDNGANCAYHTLSNKLIGTKEDRFWIDLPLTFLQFDPVKEAILQELPAADQPAIRDQYLYELVCCKAYDGEFSQADLPETLLNFIHQDVRPLINQGLLKNEPLGDQAYYRQSEAAMQMQPYFNIVSRIKNRDDDLHATSLTELKSKIDLLPEPWLIKEVIDLD